MSETDPLRLADIVSGRADASVVGASPPSPRSLLIAHGSRVLYDMPFKHAVDDRHQPVPLHAPRQTIGRRPPPWLRRLRHSSSKKIADV